MASPSPSSSSDSSCLILEDNEAPASPLPQEGAKPPSPALPPVPPPLPPQANGGPDPKPPAPRKDPAGLQAENERLFAEFVTFCAQHTADHPEVMPYLASRHQKTNPDFLASVEYRNVLGRCLTRVQARRSKIYVYINELCTVFKAHAQRRKLPIASATPAVQDGDTVAMASAASTGDTVAAAAVSTEEATPAPSDAPEGSKTRPDSRRHIRYLENLLRVYAEEIRRLQERELDLEELDREDSAYLQESRLKRRMMHIFRRLCELKDCNSLTGRVIEQRIPYRGTRYPEVNRRIERLINRNQEAFPDYADILKVVQKANVRHSLGLPKRQMESMAADAFREVGNRLQERRHLDLIYNFGSHLTDQYRPSADPALTDGDLARRLRHNREKAVQRLEEVTSQFAQLQDQSEETEWRQRKKGGRAPTTKSQTASLTGEADPGAAASAPQKGSQSPMGGRKDPVQENPQEEEDEEDEDEEEEEESSFESDMEADLAKGLESGEDDEGLPPDEEPSAAREAEADQRMDLEVMEVVLYSSVDEEEEEEEDEEEEEEEEEGEDDEKGATGAQQALLETEEVLLLDENGMPRKQKPSHPPAKRGRTLENGSSPRPGVTAVQDLNGQPPRKRGRQEHLVSDSTCIEVPSTGSSEAEDEDAQGEVVLFGSLPSTRSPAPLADSTCADSPSLGLVTSSLGSPPDQHQPEQALLLAKVCKTSVATQCDPEEIIVLSDSD